MKNYTNIILEESNQPIIKRNLRHLFDIENIPYQTFLFAVALGVGISLPNILLQIIQYTIPSSMNNRILFFIVNKINNNYNIIKQRKRKKINKLLITK